MSPHTALFTALDAFSLLPPTDTMPEEAHRMVKELLRLLEAGDVRAAERDERGKWHAVPSVKRGILLAFRIGRLEEVGDGQSGFSFVDKHTVPTRRFSVADRIRIVPGGSTVRRGAYLAPGVVCMPPMYINVGAWVGRGTMVDSHALVGSCAQIGERVHLSAAAQIGGVLEPVNASPVIIEDDVLVGGNCGIYDGTVVRKGAVLAAGVVLTRGTPVYDLVKETVYRGTTDEPLEIPANAVVVPGARAASGSWAREQGIQLQTPVIVKYRDAKTDLATALEEWLR
jgi:2,3,4,5-tetrahydropyridine-2-carboxylate N-succinyltransferase